MGGKLGFKALVILAAAIAFVSAIPAVAVAVDSADGRYDCEVLSDGTVAIEDYYGTDTSVVIPSTIVLEGGDSRTVTVIDWYSFDDCITLQSVSIPSTVTKIGNGAFEGCISLQAVVIPDSVTTLGKWVFEDCTALSSVTVGNQVAALDLSLFSGCLALSRVNIGGSVTAIGSSAFQGCASLKGLVLPDSVTAIDAYAFDDGLSVTIPARAVLMKLTSGRAKLGVRWRRDNTAAVSGFEVTAKRSGRAAKTVRAAASKTSLTMSKLTRRKRYTVKLRPFRSISGRRYYGPWTRAKTVKTK